MSSQVVQQVARRREHVGFRLLHFCKCSDELAQRPHIARVMPARVQGTTSLTLPSNLCATPTRSSPKMKIGQGRQCHEALLVAHLSDEPLDEVWHALRIARLCISRCVH
ncbi:unnamed protein product [Symbiodinium sp. CCMP2456]|nr:unnamed protein product [Symbiodinium sp. CCMP2456]